MSASLLNRPPSSVSRRLAWLAVCVLAFAGCSKNKNNDDDGDKGIPDGPDAALLGADSTLIPRDAAMFATVRLADAMETKPVRTIMAMAGGELNAVQQHIGLNLSDIRRVTFVAVDPDKVFWVVVHTNKDYDRDRVLNALNDGQQKEKPREEKVGGKSIFVSRDKAIYFVDGQQFVIGSAEGVRKCAALPAQSADGPLSEPLKLAAKKQYHAAAGFNLQSPALQAAMNKGMDKKNPGALAMAGLVAKTKNATITAILSDPLKLELTGNYATEADAKDAAAALDGVIGFARLMVGSAAEKEPMAKQAAKLLKDLKPVQDGTTVTLSAEIDSELILGLAMATTARVDSEQKSIRAHEEERIIESPRREPRQRNEEEESKPAKPRRIQEEEEPPAKPPQPANRPDKR